MQIVEGLERKNGDIAGELLIRFKVEVEVELASRKVSRRIVPLFD